jgi:hypothetical protein
MLIFARESATQSAVVLRIRDHFRWAFYWRYRPSAAFGTILSARRGAHCCRRNNDIKAPIHAEADYSMVGELYEIVPALIRACAKGHRHERQKEFQVFGTHGNSCRPLL